MELLAMAVVSLVVWAVTPAKTYYNTQYNPVETVEQASKACGQDGYIVYPQGFVHEDKVWYFKCKAKDS